MNISFKNRITLVTGGTRGIGAAIADEINEADGFVICTGTNKPDIERRNKALTNKMRIYQYLNFEDESSIQELFDFLDNYNSLDVCINNAGINIIDEYIDSKESDYESIMAVNLKGPYRLNKYCSLRMVGSGYGRIVNVCSIWSVITRSKRSLYTMSKNALHGLTQTMAVELSSKGVLVNSLSPGFTLTELTRQTNTEEEIFNIGSAIPIGRMAQPGEISKVVAFIASEANTYITGQNIVVDGGYTIV